jgi:cbb3-type cytochrome c oxidase subunit III
MTSRTFIRGALVALTGLWCAALAGSINAQSPEIGTDAQRESGKALYLKNCSQCHGEKGDGEGYAAPHLFTKPRDFTAGKFKVRSTPSGALPTHQDLVNIIKRGMPYSSMPAWPALSDQQVSDLAYYITTFSPDFSKPELVPKPVALPSAPKMTPETIEAGKKLFVDTGCVKCHGTLGRGDGPSGPTLVDDLQHPIRPADLTQNWTFRGGSTREDIFRTMTTGFMGAPMPSFIDSLSVEQRWAITDYISSLSGNNGPAYTNLVHAKHVDDTIDLKNGTASFDSAPVARFAIVGQIMEPGREFHPPTPSVSVQSIYDADSIAFLVRWHDMSAEKTGKNSPALKVPIEEEEAAPGGAKPSEANPFGDVAAAAGQQPAPADPFADTTTPAAPPSEFSDAVAIQIPSSVPATARKPYFIFGDGTNSVDLWFFDLARSDPQQFTGNGSGSIDPNDTGDITGVASFDQGEWTAIFKRPLRPTSGARFTPGEFMPIAISVWDGFSRDRGNKRGLTLWNSVYVEPEVVPSAAGPMTTTALIIGAIELILIGWVRSRYSRVREAIAPPPTRSGLGEATSL